jgi:hypothetical protein
MMSIRDLFQKNERRLSGLAACAGRFILVAANVFLCFSLVLWAQTPASQPSNANQSWTVTRESHTEDVLPSRIVESHVQNGNRIVDKQSVERVWSNGHSEAYQDIETETVQVDATTVRTITRYFGRDGGNAKALVLTTEEEMQSLPGGDSRTVRVTSAPDSDGKLQAGRREISETKKISPDVQETKTTVMLLSITGELAPAMKIEKQQQRSGNNTEFKETVQVLDAGSREWKVNEVRQGNITQEGNSRNTEERVSRLDYEGKVSEFSRTVSKESESSSGEKQSTIENYSVDMLGASRDGNLHLVQRVTSTQSTDSTGHQMTARHVQEPNPGDPDAGLRVTSFSTETIRSRPSGAEATRTVQVRNGGGEFEVFAVDTTRSDNVHAIQVQMAPSGK